MVRPTVEALGGVGGGVLGAAAGTVASPSVVINPVTGGVAGAGLGYAAAKGGLDSLETALGYRQGPQSAGQALASGVEDVATGATLEGAGRIAAPVISKVVGKVMDFGRAAPKAAKIARDAAGQDLPALKNALAAAQGQNVTAGQATADVINPTWQALGDRALSANSSGVTFKSRLAATQEAEAVNALARAAGGDTAAATRATVEQAQKNLNTITKPMKDAALNRGNLGQEVAALEARAAELGEGAAAKVQEVRDLISAGNKAEAWARLDLIKRGLPVGATKYTHFGELSGKALGEWSDAAAKGSLDLGAGARYAKQAAETMRANGIQPLKTDALTSRIRGVLSNPELAANKPVKAVVDQLAEDLAEWTTKGGVIDLHALDAIRKNSANSAIQKLLSGTAEDVQKKTAAGVMTRIKPLIDDAIEKAGGVGYKEYLARHAEGMQKIAEKKLMGEGLSLWKTSKDQFVKLVQNESPEAVEKILGPGKYDIARDLAESHMTVLREQAAKAIRDASVAKQASDGQTALRNLLLQDMSKIRLPSYLSVITSTTNKALDTLERALGKRTMSVLTEAMKTPKGANDLLNTLPANERVKILQVLNNPQSWGAQGKAVVSSVAPTVNALSADSTSQNALAP